MKKIKHKNQSTIINTPLKSDRSLSQSSNPQSYKLDKKLNKSIKSIG